MEWTARDIRSPSRIQSIFRWYSRKSTTKSTWITPPNSFETLSWWSLIVNSTMANEAVWTTRRSYSIRSILCLVLGRLGSRLLSIFQRLLVWMSTEHATLRRRRSGRIDQSRQSVETTSARIHVDDDHTWQEQQHSAAEELSPTGRLEWRRWRRQRSRICSITQCETSTAFHSTCTDLHHDGSWFSSIHCLSWSFVFHSSWIDE